MVIAALAIMLAPLVAAPAAAAEGPLTSVGIEPMTEAELDELLATAAVVEALVNEYGGWVGDLLQTPDGAYHEVYRGDPNRFKEIWLNEAFEAHDPSEVWIRLNGTTDQFKDITDDTDALPSDLVLLTYLVDPQRAIVGAIVQDGVSGTIYDIITVDFDDVDIALVTTIELYDEQNLLPLYRGVGNDLRPGGDPELSTTTTERETTTTEKDTTTSTEKDTTTTAEDTTTTVDDETTTTAAYTTTTAQATTTTAAYTTTTGNYTTTTGYATTTTMASQPNTPPQAPPAPAKNETPAITG